MKTIPEDVFGEVPESFHRAALKALEELEEPARPQKRRWVGFVAAAAAAAVLGGTALATDLFGLRDVRVADAYATVAEDIYGCTGDADIIAMQGMPGSPEYLATAEWQEFLSAYDTDGSILASAGNDPTPWDEYMGIYGVYSQEMADTLNAIAGKYGLKLHTTVEELGEVPDFAPDAAAVTGYRYEDGSFLAEIDMTVEDIPFAAQLCRYYKGFLTPTTLNIGNAEEYTEWDYETASGITVHLALGRIRSIVRAELPAAFVSVNVLGGTEGDAVFMPVPIDERALEAFAEALDLALLS